MKNILTKKTDNFSLKKLDWNKIQLDMKEKMGNDIYESWNQKGQSIVDELNNKPGLKIQIEENENRQGPQAVLYFEESWKGSSSSEIRESLEKNDPPIYVGVGGVSDEINIVVVNLKDGEETIIVNKLNELLD